MERDLEIVLKERVKPIINDKLFKVIGLTIKELEDDLTKKLRGNPLYDFSIDISIPFKEAKKLFRGKYVERLLQVHLGDVSAVARICNTDRRTIHRIIKECHIDVDKVRMDMVSKDYVKMKTIYGIIEDVLKGYEKIIHPNKMGEMYKQLNQLSEEIVKELPFVMTSLDDAEREFEISFIKQALRANNNNISKTAEKIGLRFETLHRKMKELRITSS